MTIVTTLVVSALAIVLFLAALTHRNWAALRVKRLDQGLEHLAKFERATMRLIKDDTTPDSVVELLGMISQRIGRPDLAVWAAGEILTGRMFEAQRPAKTDRGRVLRKALDQLTEPQTHLLAESIAHGLMTSASAHPILASYLQRAISFAFFAPNTDRVDDGDKARAIIVDYGIRCAPATAGLELAAA